MTKETDGEVVDLGTLKESGFFGEIALLTDQPRQTTIKAVGRVKCARLERSSFYRLLGPCEDVLRRSMAAYKKYVPH